MSQLDRSLYQVEQIRHAEQLAMQQWEIPGLTLMQRAGQAVFAEITRRWPDNRCIGVVCGAGNNAGDGYVIASLARSAGYRVTVYSLIDPELLQADAGVCYRLFKEQGGKIQRWQAEQPFDAGLIVDAVLGVGLNRPVSDFYQAAIEAINAAALPVIAVDVPSGLQADSGYVAGIAVKAVVTVTFIADKLGLHSGQAADYCGQIVVADLGLPEQLLRSLPVKARLLTKQLPPVRQLTAHKGHHGHVLLVGGNHGLSGAIGLAGAAALRSGAGLVSIATRASHSALLSLYRPELMSHGIEDLNSFEALLNKATVVVIGPGLGQDDWARLLLASVLASDKACVIDADALNLLSATAHKRDDWILTPHPGEAARLLGCSTAEIARDRFQAARALQLAYGGVAVLKGAGSIIADQERLWVSTTGNPGMASGGMGDVLAGICGALLAQGLSLAEAARLAVYVHGEAADRAAELHGQRGLLASDVIAGLSTCLN